MKKNTIVEIIAAIFILLFVYTALSKLFDPAKFKWSLGQSPLISNSASVISWLLPSTELLIATLLFIPKTRKAGTYGALGLMTVFTIYIAYMISFASNLPCSCGGVLQQMSWKQHLLFNCGFIFLAVFAIWLQRSADNKKNGIQPTIIVYT